MSALYFNARATRRIQHGAERNGGMSETRVWLVERTYNDKGMVVLVYATPDGEQYLRKQLSERMLMQKDVTAGRSVESNRLEPTDEGEIERYAAEATRMADEHDPDDAV